VRKIIICEGPDNSGKTSLIKRLAPEMGLEVRHSASHLRGSGELIDWVDKELDTKFVKPPIYDRFPLISEQVYGPILRGHNVFEGLYKGWAKDYQPLIIYCRPSLNRLLRFNPNIPQMDGVKDHAKQLVEAYDAIMGGLRHKAWGIVRYDYADMESYAKVKTTVSCYIDRYGGSYNGKYGRLD